MNRRNIDTELPIVYMISDGTLPPTPTDADIDKFCQIVVKASDDGVQLFQIREKQLSAADLVRTASAVVSAVGSLPIRVLVNERADVAIASGADGVHLTSTAMPTEAVRKIVGDEMLIAVSTHLRNEVENAFAGSADVVVYGPVFESPDKPEEKGVGELSRICSTDPEWIILGLGGIDSSNARSVLDAGASGIAAIRSLNDEQERRQLIASLK